MEIHRSVRPTRRCHVCQPTGVHRPTVAGISGSSKQGCDSIVLNGGYVDDEDYGDLIIYTGEGGQDPSGRQVRDQQLTRGNLALKLSCDEGYPVRVSRGPKGAKLWSPSNGYRYDGLYLVVRYWPDIGIHGYRIWGYRLERVEQGPTAQQLTSQESRWIQIGSMAVSIHSEEM